MQLSPQVHLALQELYLLTMDEFNAFEAKTQVEQVAKDTIANIIRKQEA